MAVEIIQNTFDGGTDGANFTTTTSAVGGNATSEDGSIVAPGTVQFTTATKRRGTSAVRHITPTGGAGKSQTRWYYGASVTRTSMSFSVIFNSFSGVAYSLCSIVDTAFSISAQLIINGAGALQVHTKSGSVKSFGTLSTGVWYRMELAMEKGTTTTDGKILGGYALDDSASLPENRFEANTVNVGTNNVGRTYVGSNTTGAVVDMVVDDFRVETDTYKYMGYVPASTPPVLTVTGYPDRMPIVATAVPGPGDTMTYNVAPADKALKLADGVYGMLRDPSTGADYTATITSVGSPSGMSDTETYLIPKRSSVSQNNVMSPLYLGADGKWVGWPVEAADPNLGNIGTFAIGDYSIGD